MTTASETRLERRLERKAAQYPRIVGMAKDMTPQRGKRHWFCAYCNDPATHRITIAVNHLPGENETRDVCAVHVVALPDNAKGQWGAEGASAAPTGCASNGTTEKEE